MKEKSDFFKGGSKQDPIVEMEASYASEFMVGLDSDEFEFEADFDMSENE